MSHKSNQPTTVLATKEPPFNLKENELKFRSMPKDMQLLNIMRQAEKLQYGQNFILDAVLDYDLTAEYLSDTRIRIRE